jgi:capsular exopolysaccharide synthesis family protein
MKSEPTLQDYLGVVIERRWLVIICVVVATLGAAITSISLPKVYEARIRFKLDLSEAKPMFFSEIYTPQRVDPVESQLEIIKSRTLARSVVQKLNLNFVVKNHNPHGFDSVYLSEDFPPGKYYLKFKDSQYTLVSRKGEELGYGRLREVFDIGSLRFLINEMPSANQEIIIQNLDARAEDLQKQISASQIKNTALVLLKAKSDSPEFAAKIANTLAEEYINYSLATIREAARGSKEFIESQIQIFGEELKQAEENLRDYKEESGIFLLDESAKEIISSLAAFEVQKEDAVVELNEVESAIEDLEDKLAKDDATFGAYKRMASFPTISNSPIILTLKQNLKDLELQRQELLQNASANSLDIADIESEIEDTKEELQKATKQIMLAGPSVEDPIFQSIISQIINNETSAIALQSRIEALDNIIARHNRRLKQLPEAEVNLAQLERQKMANEEIYTMLLGKLEESKIAEAMQISEARIIDIATVPSYPVEPKPKQNTILGFLLGLLIGVGGAFLLEYLDTSIKSSKDIEELTGLSVLATIPLVRDKSKPQIPTIDEPHSQMAEAYRILRTNLAFAATAKPIKSLLITSTIPQEGKTTTCINLGITLAQQGHRTIILDCDFRRPMLHNYLAGYIKNSTHGLSDVLIGTLKLKDAVVKSTTDNLFFITSGTIPSNPAELLGSDRMKDVVEKLKSEFEFIIFDAPPALGVADARVLGRISDGILVVIMAKKTAREAVVEVKDELERSGEKIVGFVLNGIDLTRHYYRHRYYYYYPNK